MAAAASNTNLPSPGATPSKDYGDALTKALLFYESQKSGKLSKRYLAWCVILIGAKEPPRHVEDLAALNQTYDETCSIMQMQACVDAANRACACG